MASRHRRRTSAPMTNFELLLCAVTLGAVISLLVVFLFVFHDFPLRVA